MGRNERKSYLAEHEALEEEFMDAAWDGNIHAIRRLLQKQVAVNTRDSESQTALMVAASENNVQMVKILLQHPDINVNAINNQGYTALMLAVQNNHIAVIKLLLSVPNIDISIKNHYGDTAQDLLKQSEHYQNIIELFNKTKLISDRIKNYQQRNKAATLIKAIDNDDLEVVQAILRAPRYIVDINYVSTRGTALMLAIANNDNSVNKLAIISELLSVPFINLALKNSNGEDVFHILDKQLKKHRDYLNLGLANKFLQYREEISLQLSKAQKINSKVLEYHALGNPLIIAAKRGDIEVVNAILKWPNQYDINAIDQSGRTALMNAALYGHLHIIEALMNIKDLEINMQDNNGDTALMLAVKSDSKNHVNIIKYLLNISDININIKNKDDLTALELLRKMRATTVSHTPGKISFVKKFSSDTYKELIECFNKAQECGLKLLADALEIKENQHSSSSSYRV